jgi:hypothetical protein
MFMKLKAEAKPKAAAEPAVTYLRHAQALFIHKLRYHVMFVKSLTKINC